MILLRAYIDDSASEIGDQRLFMAGYVNRIDKWSRFSSAWAEELRLPPAIDYLKMSEAQSLKGQFSGWTHETRDEKLRGLARVIRHFQPFSFEFSVSRRDFHSLVKPVSPRGLGNPHFTCCFGALSIVARYLSEYTSRVSIEFFFDRQEGVDADIRLFFDHMILSLPNAARKVIAGKPRFEDDKQHLPLQAADMLAWHVRREHEAHGTRGALAMANLLRNTNGHLTSQISESTLKSWAAHHSQQPGVPLTQSKSQWRHVKSEIARLTALGVDCSKIGMRQSIAHRLRDQVIRVFKLRIDRAL